ncbi:hypothetical protein D3C80_1544610 [compost metagenome]
MGEAFQGDAGQRNASIGKGKQGQDTECNPRVQGMFQGQQGRGFGVAGAQGNAQGQRDTGQRRVHAALEYAHPEDQADDHVRAQLDHAQAIHRHQCHQAGPGQHQRQARQLAGIEQGDDDDCA